MNEVETAEEEEEAKKRAVAAEEEKVLVPFLPNCCLAVAPSATTSSNSTLAGHGGTQWREAESEAAPKWQLQQPNSSFCGREMTLGTSNNSSLSSSQWSGQQGQHVNCRFLGAVGQQTSVSFGNLSGQNSSSSSSSVHHHHHRSAKKRIRTTFGRSQLDTLRECFKRSHKPNSAQLCTLVRRTGLSKRVIQVWFQNQRSKWLRHMFERYSSGSSSEAAAAAAAVSATIGPHIVQPAGPLGELFADDLCLCLPPSMSAMRTTTMTAVDAAASAAHSNGQRC